MYWEVWYNNKSLPENQSLIYYENILLGVPRLRQVKVRNESCSVHEDLRDEVQDCYNIYTPANEDTAPFGPKNGTAYVQNETTAVPCGLHKQMSTSSVLSFWCLLGGCMQQRAR